MSPSTLSRQIQRMEEELEQPLFIRDNRQVRLTEQGENFCNLRKQNGKTGRSLSVSCEIFSGIKRRVALILFGNSFI